MTHCPSSTYCSDPNACFTVESMHETCSGIWGYYTNEFDAAAVAKYLKQNNHTHVSVKAYDPKNPPTGIHPLVEAKLKGY